MKQVTTIGLDIAKSVFLVHGVDAAERVVLGQKLSRSGVVKVTEVGRWRGVSWSNPRKAKRAASAARCSVMKRSAIGGGAAALRADGLASPPFRIPCYVGRKTEAIAPRCPPSPFEDT